ncbi:hypothetical protein [Pedobacter sp. R-06]|uniref:hypothetical protein n=1 Tax=Pedobacter sp. R-06 TaxID=3404051 RepID=UPI003CECB508
MLFSKLIIETEKEVEQYFDTLFDMAVKNQVHSGDLLLVMEGALLSREKDYDNPDAVELKNYYNIGKGLDGHCEDTNYGFIAEYVNSTENESFEDYKKAIEFDPVRSHELRDITEGESITIQIEMLIYLKIWEGETFLKKFYQLLRLVNREEYDWHCTVNGFGKAKQGSLSRAELLSFIKSQLETHIPGLSTSFNECHVPQVRNAISHSQYAIIGRDIMFNNYEPEREGSIRGISFDDWTDMFHRTLAIFHLYNKLFRRIRLYYYESSAEFRHKKEVRVNRIFPELHSFHLVLHTRPIFMDWGPSPDNY